jgi:hypothetical protein
MALRLEKCPVCRTKRFPEISKEDVCPRCGAELISVNQCYRQAGTLRNQCRQLLAADRVAKALSLARRAHFLVDEPETRQLLAAALLANKQVSRAIDVLENTVLSVAGP